MSESKMPRPTVAVIDISRSTGDDDVVVVDMRQHTTNPRKAGKLPESRLVFAASVNEGDTVDRVRFSHGTVAELETLGAAESEAADEYLTAVAKLPEDMSAEVAEAFGTCEAFGTFRQQLSAFGRLTGAEVIPNRGGSRSASIRPRNEYKVSVSFKNGDLDLKVENGSSRNSTRVTL